MTTRWPCQVPRGQAAIEALLALTLLGAMMQAVASLGDGWLRGQQAAQLSRLAAFSDAGQSDRGRDDDGARVLIEFVSLDGEHRELGHDARVNEGPREGPREGSRLGARRNASSSAGTPPQTVDGVPDDTDSATSLARDWLHIDPRLRRARATVGPKKASWFASVEQRVAARTIHRQTVIAADVGHGMDDATVSRRLTHSRRGWSVAARHSTTIADTFKARVQAVDAAWSRGAWTTDWSSAWADLPTASSGASGPDRAAAR